MYTKIIIFLSILFSLYILHVNKNNIKEGKFESHRLGNVIDMWYFSNFKEFRDKKISDINNFDTRKNDSFSYFLLKNKNIYKKPGDLNLVGYWPIYYYQNIINVSIILKVI